MSNRRKIPSVDLLTTGVAATTYGSATAVPVLTINAQGQVTSATTASISPDTTITAYNGTGGSLAAGTLVYVSGYNVANSAQAIAAADADDPQKAATYVVDSAIADAGTGTCSKIATLTAQNTSGGAVGDAWYLSATAGSGTRSAPTGADQIQQIVGRIITVDAATGTVAVDLTAAPVSKAGTAFLQTSVGLTTPKITTSINDANGNESLRIAATDSAVNELTVTNAAAGNGVSILATGDDTNIAVQFGGKGNGAVVLGQATSTDVRLAADQPIADSSGNEFIKFSKTASAVNEITVTNAATGSGPSVTATGGDTNVPITLAGKGTGKVVLGQATSASLELGGLAAGSSLDINDAAGNEAITLSSVASAVNELTILNAATGNSPTIGASGGDTNIGIAVRAKGNSGITLDGSGLTLQQNEPLLDSSGNELLAFSSTASAVNEVTITNAATANDPAISATGGDTNIDLALVAKGTGGVILNTGSTPLTKFVVYSQTITPAEVAANTTALQTFTVTGLETSDKVFVNPNGFTEAVVLGFVRVSAQNTLQVQFTNPTAGALTPTAGTWLITAMRS